MRRRSISCITTSAGCSVAIAYAISPIDLISDFIPLLGYLDDVVIVPTLIVLAVKPIPKEVVDDCRHRANDSN
jgi:uncharacterized membrane protein YkvA (DUF1232 family)